MLGGGEATAIKFTFKIYIYSSNHVLDQIPEAYEQAGTNGTANCLEQVTLPASPKTLTPARGLRDVLGSHGHSRQRDLLARGGVGLADWHRLQVWLDLVFFRLIMQGWWTVTRLPINRGA